MLTAKQDFWFRRDPDALGERLALLCQDRELRESCSKTSLEWVQQFFTWRQVTRMIADVYKELLARTWKDTQNGGNRPLSDRTDCIASTGRHVMADAAVFLDKDGTLVPDIPYNADPERMVLAAGAASGLQLLQRHGYRLIVVSNQPGIAYGLYPEQALVAVERKLRGLLMGADVVLDGFYYCPHHLEGKVAEYAIDCECRKPRPGMLLRAARELDVDLSQSWMVGDILNDVEAGCRTGCRTLLLLNGGESEWKLTDERLPDLVATDLHKGAVRITESSLTKKLNCLEPDRGMTLCPTM